MTFCPSDWSNRVTHCHRRCSSNSSAGDIRNNLTGKTNRYAICVNSRVRDRDLRIGCQVAINFRNVLNLDLDSMRIRMNLMSNCCRLLHFFNLFISMSCRR